VSKISAVVSKGSPQTGFQCQALRHEPVGGTFLVGANASLRPIIMRAPIAELFFGNSGRRPTVRDRSASGERLRSCGSLFLHLAGKPTFL
jgi:hypothetical protein